MKRILIVEDDRAIAELERDYLEANDYEVEICEDGESGLKRALQEDFALILLDVMLPRIWIKSGVLVWVPMTIS